MNKLILVVSLSLLMVTVNAQENPDTSYWKFGGLGSVSVNQVSLTNWAAGGESSFSGSALLNTSLNYNRENISWENLFGLAYGLMKQGDAGVKKTDDKIDFASKFGRKASKKLFYSVMFKFNTQFTDGYKYPNDSVPISTFMAPGIMNLSIGIDYKPSEHLSIYLGPLSGKVTFVLDDSLSAKGAFGVEEGKQVRYEFGGSFKGMYTQEILKNVTLTTKLELFSNYIKDPEKIDVSWEVLINMRINEYLSANLNTHLVWDDDIKFAQFDSEGNYTGSESKVQFKEVFGIGLSYKF
jgi:hypothetical protein